MTSAALSLCQTTNAKMHTYHQTKSFWNETRSSLFALHPWIHNSRRNCAKIDLITFPKKQYSSSGENYWAFCAKKPTAFWRLWPKESFHVVFSTKRHMLHEIKPRRLRFVSEALTRLITCNCPRWCIIFTSSSSSSSSPSNL